MLNKRLEFCHTQHVGSDVRRILDAFIYNSENGGPVALLNEVKVPIYELKSAAYTMQTLVGDAFIVSLYILGVSYFLMSSLDLPIVPRVERR